MKSVKYIVGIDEAGRGPLAGPVAIGAVIMKTGFDLKLLKEIKNKDSKKLTESQRETWYKNICEFKKSKKLNFCVSLISPSIIDKMGISYAIKSGIKNSLKKLNVNPNNSLILLDGSLKAPAEFKFQKTIIKGDEKIQAISLASIAAKVTRDKKMRLLAKKYTKYSFEIHKGYGTLTHRKLISKYGPCDIHRMSFLANLIEIR